MYAAGCEGEQTGRMGYECRSEMLYTMENRETCLLMPSSSCCCCVMRCAAPCVRKPCACVRACVSLRRVVACAGAHDESEEKIMNEEAMAKCSGAVSLYP